jgi:hypothetical protein
VFLEDSGVDADNDCLQERRLRDISKAVLAGHAKNLLDNNGPANLPSALLKNQSFPAYRAS